MKPTVTPYLPDTAQEIARNWMATRKQPAFSLPHEQRLDTCPNCQDYGFVTLILCESGPYNAFVPSGKDKDGRAQIVTWFDGDATYSKGWYVKQATNMYPCPECEKRRHKDAEYIPLPEVAARMRDHKPVIEALAAKMRSKKQLGV